MFVLAVDPRGNTRLWFEYPLEAFQTKNVFSLTTALPVLSGVFYKHIANTFGAQSRSI